MFFSWNFNSREKTLVSLFFLSGFLGGIAAVCFWPEVMVENTGFLSPSFINRLKDIEVNSGGLFWYSLRKRMGAACFLLLSSTAGMSAAGIGVMMLWAGGAAGTVLTALSMRYGLKGLLLFVFSLLPQQLLLVPACLMLMDSCFKRRETKKLLFVLAVVITGCVLESYVNPMILKVVLKFF